MAAERLTGDDVERRLAGVRWVREGDHLEKAITLANFAEAMAFVNQVAARAEAANHHPDIAISWNRVTLRLTTHDSGGLTARDFDLAAEIDSLEHE